MTFPQRIVAARIPSEPNQRVRAGNSRSRGGAPVLALIGALGLTGCYGPMYAQPYGQPYAPYGQPVYPGTAPGGQYYPGVSPGATFGTPTLENPSSMPNSSGGNAPSYYGTPSSSTQNRPVPDYGDQYYPNSGSSGFDSTTESDSEGFRPPLTGGGVGEISYTREVRDSAGQEYAYDTESHRWVQGIVSYDPRDKTWGIVYSDNPAPNDPYSGYLTLVSNPKLNVLKDGDVVRLEGEVDPTHLDYSSRPSYAVRQITVLSR
jgi:hypothetical protein